MEWLLALTGLGRIHRVPARATSKPQLCWAIDAQEDCLELLGMIESCGFHGRRAAELRLWSDAVRVWTGSGGAARRSELRRLKTGLAAARRFGGGEQCASRWDTHRQFLGYISGFVCAEGCFGFSDGRPRFSVHLRRDDESLLQLLSEETGLGNVTRYRPGPPLNPSATWTITRRSELGELRDLLWKAGLPGRKLREMEIWERRSTNTRVPSASGVRRVAHSSSEPGSASPPRARIDRRNARSCSSCRDAMSNRSHLRHSGIGVWRKAVRCRARSTCAGAHAGRGNRRATRSCGTSAAGIRPWQPPGSALGLRGLRVRPAARSGGKRIAASSGRRSRPRCNGSSASTAGGPGRASSSGGGSSRWSMHRRRAPCTGCSPAGGPRCFRSRVRRCRRRGRRPRTPPRRAGRGSSFVRGRRRRPTRRRRRNRRRRAPVRGRWTGRR